MHCAPMVKKPRNDIPSGTLGLLILRTLARGSLHGYGIAQQISLISNGVLEVEEGSLYPALQRLLLEGWVAAEWKTSLHNRRARYYCLTAAGRKQLAHERGEFTRVFGAIVRVLQTT
jgi:PadR family transcriptional regulator, regulatory protein PadR